MIKKSVQTTQNGVKIDFKNVKLETITTMVQNCAEGKCECMSDETKQKIQNMQVIGQDGKVELHLEGEVSKEEIEAALQRSKVLNSN